MSNLFTKEQFKSIISRLEKTYLGEVDFLYDIYEGVSTGIEEMGKTNNFIGQVNINPIELICYILGEFAYSTSGLSEESLNKFKENDKIIASALMLKKSLIGKYCYYYIPR